MAQQIETLAQQNVQLQGQVGHLEALVQGLNTQLQELQERAQHQPDPAVEFQRHLTLERGDRAVDREAGRLDCCDGEDPAQVKKYLKEVQLVPDNHKLEVVRRTARGPLRREFERYVTGHLAANWGAIAHHLTSSFVSSDNQEALRGELHKIKQEPFETILSFNRRFRELAQDAYPAPGGNRNADQERQLIRAYGKGLALDKVARKLTAQGWPATLEMAMERTATFETADTVYDHLGRSTEPMEVGAAATTTAPLRPQGPPFHGSTQPQPPKEMQQMRTHIAKLEAQIKRLQDQPPSRRPPRTCYNCNRPGHIARECSASQGGRSRQASFPQKN